RFRNGPRSSSTALAASNLLEWPAGRPSSVLLARAAESFAIIRSRIVAVYLVLRERAPLSRSFRSRTGGHGASGDSGGRVNSIWALEPAGISTVWTSSTGSDQRGRPDSVPASSQPWCQRRIVCAPAGT